MANKIVHGGRAKVYIDNKLVGIFESCTVSKSFGTEPVHILGSFIPQEIVLHSVDAVSVSCSGFRITNQGLKVLPRVPKVQDLLNFEPFTIVVVDRKDGVELETILNCVPSNDNTNYNARASSRVQVNYMGILAYNESGTESENGSASQLP